MALGSVVSMRRSRRRKQAARAERLKNLDEETRERVISTARAAAGDQLAGSAESVVHRRVVAH